MIFNKVSQPITLISEAVLIISRKNIRKHIKSLQDDIRESEDEDFKESKRKKIEVLKLIVKDLTTIIKEIRQ